MGLKNSLSSNDSLEVLLVRDIVKLNTYLELENQQLRKIISEKDALLELASEVITSYQEGEEG